MMNCPKCNAVIDDDSAFCVYCGEAISAKEKNDPEKDASGNTRITASKEGKAPEEKPAEGKAPEEQSTEGKAPEEKPAEEQAPEKKTTIISAEDDSALKKIYGDKARLIGLIAGTVLIAVGFYRISNAGTSISSTSFGGDFYTYTYQGIVAVSEILASIEETLGWVIVSIGAAIDVISLR